MSWGIGSSTVVAKPSLANAEGETLPAALANFRLLVPADSFNPAASRSIQRDASLRPSQVTVSGRQHWAIPPNPNHATGALPNGWTSWATIWDDILSLAAGQSYAGNGDRGVLAFYVPNPSNELELTGLWLRGRRRRTHRRGGPGRLVRRRLGAAGLSLQPEADSIGRRQPFGPRRRQGP